MTSTFGQVKRRKLQVEAIDSDHVEVELLVSGVCTMAAVIPVEATIDEVRNALLERVNAYLRYERWGVVRGVGFEVVVGIL